MKVKCVLCDNIVQLDDQLPLAKRLRNRPIHTFMCEVCHDRITEQVESRKSNKVLKPTMIHLEKESEPG